MNIILSISKSAVFKEVAQTTSYTGAKMDDDANATSVSLPLMKTSRSCNAFGMRAVQRWHRHLSVCLCRRAWQKTATPINLY